MTAHQPPILRRAPDADLIPRLRAIVGEKNVLTADADVGPYVVEWRDLFRGACAAVVRPGSTAEVSEVVKVAAALGAPIVPQGGNTGAVAGQTPFDTGAIVLSMRRMDRLRRVDPASNALIVEAGMTLAAVQQAAADVDRLFPLSLASEGSCTIGGNIGANAGGTAVLAYGNTRDLVLGLEVVLADGRVIDGLKTLRKDNTGYDLKNLFVGSEGTLGIVTAAALKLFPRPKAMETAMVAFASPEAILAFFERASGVAGRMLTTFEFIPAMGLDFVVRHAPGTRAPFAERYPWVVLMELSSGSEGSLRPVLEGLVEGAFEAGEALDAVIAESLDQRKALWRLREDLPDMQKHEGGSIKHDVSVPIAALPRFLAEASAAVEALVPGCRVCAFGHFGDGNVHFNVSQPVGMDKAAYIARWEEMNAIVHAIVTRLDGSISAEHGIGYLKRDLLPGVKSAAEMDVMRAIKRALDPAGVFNPGKVV